MKNFITICKFCYNNNEEVEINERVYMSSAVAINLFAESDDMVYQCFNCGKEEIKSADMIKKTSSDELSKYRKLTKKEYELLMEKRKIEQELEEENE